MISVTMQKDLNLLWWGNIDEHWNGTFSFLWVVFIVFNYENMFQSNIIYFTDNIAASLIPMQ